MRAAWALAACVVIGARMLNAAGSVTLGGSAAQQLILVRCPASLLGVCAQIEDHLSPLWNTTQSIGAEDNFRTYRPASDEVALLREKSPQKIFRLVLDVKPRSPSGRWRMHVTNSVYEGGAWRKVRNAGEFRFPSDFEVSQGTRTCTAEEFAARAAELAETIVFK